LTPSALYFKKAAKKIFPASQCMNNQGEPAGYAPIRRQEVPSLTK
jgi:hypothetical protein